jgi:hypothetical protein
MREVPFNQITKVITPGCVLWRPMRSWQGVMHPELSHVEFNHQDGKTSFVKTMLDGYGQGIPEPVVNPYRGPGKVYGLITFVEALPQDCWTHLVVLSVGRDGRSMKALPECLPDVDAYIRWRMIVESLYAEREINGSHQLAERVAGVPCPGMRPDRKRVNIFRGITEGTYLA